MVESYCKSRFASAWDSYLTLLHLTVPKAILYCGDNAHCTSYRYETWVNTGDQFGHILVTW